MGLASYKTTRSGSAIQSTVGSGKFSIPSSNQGVNLARTMAQQETRKGALEDKKYLVGLKNGLLKGTISETQYYVERAGYYEKKMNSASDPVSATNYENSMLLSMNMAKDSAESASNKARSAQQKAATAEANERQEVIKNLENGVASKLKYGGYNSTKEYLADVTQLKEIRQDFFNTVASSDVFSDAKREQAADQVSQLNMATQDVYSNYSATGIDYGGLDYKSQNPDRFVVYQETTGENAGKVVLKEAPGMSNQEYNGRMVKGADNIYRDVSTIGRYNQQTGDLDYIDPVTGEAKVAKPGSEEFAKYEKQMATTVIDPDTKQRKTFLLDDSDPNNLKWKGTGENENVTYRKPGWDNAPINLTETFKGTGVDVSPFEGNLNQIVLPGDPRWQGMNDEYDQLKAEAEAKSKQAQEEPKLEETTQPELKFDQTIFKPEQDNVLKNIQTDPNKQSQLQNKDSLGVLKEAQKVASMNSFQNFKRKFSSFKDKTLSIFSGNKNNLA